MASDEAAPWAHKEQHGISNVLGPAMKLQRLSFKDERCGFIQAIREDSFPQGQSIAPGSLHSLNTERPTLSCQRTRETQ